MARNAWDAIIASYIKPGDMVRHKPTGEHGIVIRRQPTWASTLIEIKFPSQVRSVDYKEIERVFVPTPFRSCKLDEK